MIAVAAVTIIVAIITSTVLVQVTKANTASQAEGSNPSTVTAKTTAITITTTYPSGPTPTAMVTTGQCNVLSGYCRDLGYNASFTEIGCIKPYIRLEKTRLLAYHDAAVVTNCANERYQAELTVSQKN